MRCLRFFLLTALALVSGVGLFVYSGLYHIGADQPHWSWTYQLIDSLRHRSVIVRAGQIDPPEDLGNLERQRRGAGNYDAMCVSCHLKPGMPNTELRIGMYPQPPNLAKHGHDSLAEQFWIIKHGIKMTGMPAWGQAGVDDQTIWDMVALLQALPGMTAAEYDQLVASSDGHSHAGDAHRQNGSDSDHHESSPVSTDTGHYGHHQNDKESKPHAH